LKITLRFPKTIRLFQHGLDLLPILFTLIGERFFEQSLVFIGFSFAVLATQSMVRRGNEGIKFQRFEQELFFTWTELKDQRAFAGAKEFHDSRSIVACSVYF